jgi:hypothetical protein
LAFKDSRSGSDLLLQRNDPPTEDDFLSHAALGVRPNSAGPPYRTAQWFGVSMSETREAVDFFIERQRERGETYLAAEVTCTASQKCCSGAFQPVTSDVYTFNWRAAVGPMSYVVFSTHSFAVLGDFDTEGMARAAIRHSLSAGGATADDLMVMAFDAAGSPGRTPSVRSARCESFDDPVEWVEGAFVCRDAGTRRSRLSGS